MDWEKIILGFFNSPWTYVVLVAVLLLVSFWPKRSRERSG